MKRTIKVTKITIKVTIKMTIEESKLLVNTFVNPKHCMKVDFGWGWGTC